MYVCNKLKKKGNINMTNLFNALAKATANAVKTTFKEFDFEKEMRDAQKTLTQSSRYLAKEMKRLTKHINNYFDKWVVDVNFNQDEDIIKSQVKDGTITITVTKESTNAETVFQTTIPDDVIISSLVQKYDAKNHKAFFIFTKKDVVETKKNA